jgi:hypothetical protein
MDIVSSFTPDKTPVYTLPPRTILMVSNTIAESIRVIGSVELTGTRRYGMRIGSGIIDYNAIKRTQLLCPLD